MKNLNDLRFIDDRIWRHTPSSDIVSMHLILLMNKNKGFTLFKLSKGNPFNEWVFSKETWPETYYNLQVMRSCYGGIRGVPVTGDFRKMHEHTEGDYWLSGYGWYNDYKGDNDFIAICLIKEG